MAVAHAEEMEPEVVHHVGHQDVNVLVLLVWVAWLVAHARGESELGDAVELLQGHRGTFTGRRLYRWSLLSLRLVLPILTIYQFADLLELLGFIDLVGLVGGRRDG